MNAFLTEYGICIVLLLIGIFHIIMAYLSYGKSSSVPFLGGILIIIAFLTSPLKFLAVLGLSDPTFWYIPYDLISDFIKRKRVLNFISDKNYLPGKVYKDKELVVSVPIIKEELHNTFITNKIHNYNIPKCSFLICETDSGRVVIFDKGSNCKNFEILPFKDNSITLPGLKYKSQDAVVILEIKSVN